jgi:serine/threonine protein kinase
MYKSTFIPPKHIFPDNHKRIKSNEYLILISPFFDIVQFIDDYVYRISPSYHIEHNSLIKSKKTNSAMQVHPKTEIDAFNSMQLLKARSSFTNKNINLELIKQQTDIRKETFDYSIPFIESNFTNLICPHDFEIVEVVGKGGLGKVSKVKYKVDGNIYAMKSFRKSKLKEAKQVEHAFNEKKILGSISHPFIVNIKYSFQSETKLYLIMEYLSGGEIYYHLRKTKYFSEKTAKFYLAQLVCVLDFLHENGIIYRDLKPENLVLDSNGYLKLTDFGIAKNNIKPGNTTNTFCGSAEYLSPEMIKGDYYNQSVDIWSLGIVFFEMLIGVPPFFDKNIDKLYKKIFFNDPNYNINKNVKPSEQSIDLINKLLTKNQKERISIKDVKKHSFFKDFNFEKLINFELDPPIRVMNTEINKYKDKSLNKEVLVDSVYQGLSYNLKDNTNFENFTFENQDFE